MCYSFATKSRRHRGWGFAVKRKNELGFERESPTDGVLESAQRLANLLTLSYEPMLAWRLDGPIEFWNAGAERLYGFAQDEAVGRTSHALLQTEFPIDFSDLRSQLRDRRNWFGELHHICKDGSKVVVESHMQLFSDSLVLEANRDITKRRQMEESLRGAQEELAKRAAELEAANKELEAFTYSVSHDLRAPLRHVLGYAELLQKQSSSILDDKARRYMAMILEASKRMGSLIDDLLGFSRIGRAEAKKTSVNLDQLVREVIAELGQDTKDRNIAWTIGALPVCYGDRSMLKLVLANLLSNAVKFTRTRARAKIEIGCAAGKDNQVEVFVTDDGAGFEMQYVNKLFGVFQRLHRAEEFEGTGIGLATVQRIIHRHGGTVRAEGAVDQGATFYFSLPRR
jgi:PAS domain S-box-containing protein